MPLRPFFNNSAWMLSTPGDFPIFSLFLQLLSLEQEGLQVMDMDYVGYTGVRLGVLVIKIIAVLCLSVQYTAVFRHDIPTAVIYSCYLVFWGSRLESCECAQPFLLRSAVSPSLFNVTASVLGPSVLCFKISMLPSLLFQPSITLFKLPPCCTDGEVDFDVQMEYS